MDDEENPFLNELVRVLDNDVPDDDNRAAGLTADVPDGENPLLDELVRVLEEDGDDHEAHDGPAAAGVPGSPHAGAQLVRRYLSSSSAKRRVRKDEHCNFCHLHLNKATLEDHLNTTESCKLLYLRRAHLKTVPAVMVHSFGCLYCDNPFNKLQVHLRSSPDCLRQFCARFSVDTVE